MQPNSITLSVNTDNDDGTTAEVDSVFTRFEEFQNRSEYIHSNHTLSVRNKLGFYRTTPKKNGNFVGVAKSAFKVTKDHEVDGVDATTSNVAPAIVDVGFSFPLGMTPAQTLEMRMTAAAMILDDSVMVPLTDQLMV
jgi:hypothetical protein